MKKNRILSIMVVVFMCANLLNSPVYAAVNLGTGDVAKLQDYASRNYYTGKGLCAEYVFDCLVASGIGIKNQTYPDAKNQYNSIMTWAPSQLYYFDKETTYDIIWFDRNSSLSITESWIKNNISIGDLIYYDDTRDWNYNAEHVVICYAKDSSGYPLYTGHNKSAYNERVYSYSSSNSQSILAVVKIPFGQQQYDPQGVIDNVVGGSNTVTVSGWAFDRDSLSVALQIHVYIGGPSGSANAETHIITADKSRPDVNSAYPGVGNNHGFEATISTNKTGLQSVYVYAINAPGTGGNNVLLGSKTVTIQQQKAPDIRFDRKFSEYGQGYSWDNATMTDTFYVGTQQYYMWYRLYDKNTNNNLNTDYKYNFEVELQIYYPNGTLLFSHQYKNSDCDWIRTNFTTPGQYKCKWILTGDYYGTYEQTITVKSREYTITYNANGGSGAPSSQIKTHGVALTLSSTRPTRSGYDFLGWSTNSSASTAQYQPSGSFTTDANTTLYAVWKGNTNCTVTFNPNGGSASSASKNVVQSNTVGTLPTATRTGYEFQGWYTSATGGRKIDANEVIIADVTYYAQWKTKTFTVTFDANGGSGVSSPQTKTQGVQLTLSGTRPTRTGYTFLGWSTSSTATTAQYQPGGSFTTDANTTLYAVWQVISFTITFDANGGSVSPASMTVTTSGTYSLPIPTRSLYTFIGWFTARSGGTRVNSSESLTVSSDITLYAQWSQSAYTVTFNANGGSVSPLNISVTNGSTYGTLPTPTRTGYAFVGWFTASSGGTMVTSSDTVNLNGNQTLYAQWTQQSAAAYTITFNANGGSVSPVSAQTDTNGRLTSHPTPTRSGYIFDGWFTQTSGGTQITTSTVFTADSTIYAQWRQQSDKTPVQNPYQDIYSGDWYYDAVMFVYQRGLMIGMDDGRFAPNDTLTREQAIQIIARLAGDDYLRYGGQPFNDVAADRWSAPAIAWAKATGVTNGVGNNLFAPTSLVTLDQFEVMLMRHFNVLEQWNGNSTACSRVNAAWILYDYVTRYE